MTDLTAHDLLERLQGRYAPPEWIVLSEVRNATGAWRSPRSADALAFSTYPSRGLALLGFEFKVTRGDWLRELKNPDKSVAMQAKCDKWYVVVSDPDIVQPGELPATWGLMVPYRDKLKVVAESKANEKVTWPRDFVASLVRNALATGSERDKRAGDEAYERGVKAGIAQQELNDKHSREEFSRLADNVRKFETATGLRIDRYMTDRCVDALATKIKLAQRMHLPETIETVKRYSDSLEALVQQLRAATAAVVAPAEPTEQVTA